MKKLRALLALAALALFLGARADAATIMSAQATVGYGTAWALTTTDDATAHWTAVWTCVNSAGAATDGCGLVLQMSVDSGTTWGFAANMRGPNGSVTVPSCGVNCLIRAYAFDVDAEHKATVTIVSGGAITPAYPTYTPTRTPTITPTPRNTSTPTYTPTSNLNWPTLTPVPTTTPTKTPTVTPTFTSTITPTATRTPLPTSTATRTPTATPTATATPTGTPPTATATPTATPTPTPTPTNRFVGP